jgi:hypothetical protein
MITRACTMLRKHLIHNVSLYTAVLVTSANRKTNAIRNCASTIQINNYGNVV